MSSREKKISFRKGLLSKSMIEKLKIIIRDHYEVDPSRYIESVLKYLCINELCIIYSSSKPDKSIIYEGSWIALYSKKTLAPSIPLVKAIYREHGIKAAIIVAEKGVKTFLYGKDILPESIIEIIPPKKTLYVVIDSTDNEILGYAKWNPSKRAYENIYDIGIFLRQLG